MRRYADQLSNRAAELSQQLMAWMFAFLAPARGQGLVEYGLILVLIAIVCVGILTMTGETLSEVWYSKIIPAFPD